MDPARVEHGVLDVGMAHPVLNLLEAEAFVQQVTAAGVLEGVTVAQLRRPPGGGAGKAR